MTDLMFEANLPKFNESSPRDRVVRYGLLGTTALCAAALAATPAMATPKGGKVTGGKATISQSGSTTTVKQSSKKAALTWKSLDVGTAESLVFQQPGTDAIALNRVLSDLPTKVLGNLTANGNVWIVNPNGIAFGPKSVVNVGGLLATTTDIPDADFFSDDFAFSSLTGSEAEYSKITAEGTIYAGKGGVVLVAPVIENSGLITTAGGDVTLATAQAFRVDFDGDGLLSFTVEAGAEGVLQLTESSSISAAGGAVYLSAGAADTVTESVVNVGGMVESTHVEQRGGEIILSGGLGSEVIVTAELSAIGAEGQKGGSIDVFGDTVKLASGASLDVSGPAGGGSIRVGGDYQGKGDAPTAETTWVTADAMLNADATVDGDGGRIIVWADDTTIYEGALTARGAGSGDGGFAEISGKQNLGFAGTVDLSAPFGENGLLLLDPENIVIGAVGANDGEIGGGDGTVSGGSGTFTISFAAIEGLNNGTDLIMTATEDITVNASFTMPGGGDSDITFTAGDDITVSSSVTISTDGFLTFDAGGEIRIGDNASLIADSNITFTADGVGNTGTDAAITFGVSSSLTSNDGFISITSNGDASDSNSILMGGDFSASASTTLIFDSSDRIAFGAVLDASGTQVFSDSDGDGTGSITIESGSGATFSAGLDIVFLSDPDSTTDATEVDVTGSALFTVTGASNTNDIIFQDDAAFSVSGGTAEFQTTTAGDIEIQQDVSILATSTGSLTFDSADDVEVGTSVTISADDDITVAGGQTFIAAGNFLLDAGDDLTFDTGGTTTIGATGAITLMAGGDIFVDDDLTFNAATSVDFDAGGDFDFRISSTVVDINSSASISVTSGDDIFLGFNENITSAGDITLKATDNVSFSGSVDLLSSGSILIEAAFQDVSGDDAGGSVSIGNNFTANAAGGSLIIRANADDGGDANDNDILFDGGADLDASTTISILSSDDVILGRTDEVETLTMTAPGGVTISGDNGILVNSTNNDDTTVNVDAGNLILTSTGGQVDLNEDGAFNITNGDAVITANDLDVASGGQIDVSDSTGTLTLVANSGEAMTLGSGGSDFTVQQAVFGRLSAESIIFQTTDSTLTVNDINYTTATSNSLELVSGGAVSFDGNSDISVGLDVQSTGTVTIESNDSLTVDGAGNDLTIVSSDLVFGNGSSAIFVTDTLTLTAVGDADMSLGGAETWNLSNGELDTQINAAAIVIETGGTGSITISGVNFDLDGGEPVSLSLTLDSGNDVTFSGSSSVISTAFTVIADDDVTIDVDTEVASATITAGASSSDTGVIAINEELEASSGTLTLIADSVTEGASGSVVTSGVLNITATDSVDLGQAANAFGGRVNVDASGSVSLVTSGTLPIGLINASDATFDAAIYDDAGATDTTFVNVGTGTATLFFGSETVTVTDTGPADDTLDLTNVDEDDFTFFNSEAAVGIGTAGNITVDGANWTSQGISLISTTGSVTFSTTASSFGGAISIQSSGSITQDVEISSGGQASFQSDNDVILTDASNSFTGALSASGSNVTIVNSGPTTLGDVETTAAFDLTSAGSVSSATDSGSMFISSFNIGTTTDITINNVADADVELVSSGVEATSFNGVITVDASGSGTLSDVTIGANGPITVAALDIGGNLDLTGDVGDTATIGIAQGGAWDVSGSTSLDAGLGDIVVTNASNTLAGALSLFGDEASATVDTAVELGKVDLRNLVLNASGAIDDGAGVTSDTNVVVTETATFSSTSTIELDNPTNDFGTIEITSGTTAVVADANGIVLGGLTLSGAGSDTLVITAGGPVTQSSAITGITGEVDISSSSSVTLNDGSNDFAVLSLTADSASVTDNDDITFGDVAVSNTLTVNPGGNIGQSGGAAMVVGALDANAAGFNVTLSNAGNDFGSIDIVAANSTIVDAKDGVSIVGASLTGNFELTTTDDLDDGAADPADADVSQSGPMFIDGTTMITAGASGGNFLGDIILDNGSNDFIGDVSLFGAAIEVHDANLVSIGTIDADSLVLSVNDIEADFSGTITITDGFLELALNTVDDIVLGGVEGGVVSDSYTFWETTTDVIFTAEEILALGVEDVRFRTAGDIYFEGLVLTGSETVDIGANSTGGEVEFVVFDTVLGGDLIVSASASITQHNGVDDPTTFIDVNPMDGINEPENYIADVSIAGRAEFNAGDDVLLTNTGNDFSTLTDAVSGSADIFSIRDVNFIALGEINASESVSIVAGNNLFINDSISSDGSILLSTSGAIFDNGTTVDDAVSAGTDLNIVGVNGVLIDQTAMDGGSSVIISTTAGNANLADITSGGVVIIGATGAASTVNLDGVSATGNIVVNSSNSITLGNGVVETAGNLSLSAGGAGDITDTGTGSVNVAGTTTLVAVDDAVILDNVANDFGGAIFIAADNATIVDANGVLIGGATFGGSATNDLSITANADGSSTGTITQSAAITVNDLNLQAGGGDVTLTQANLINGVIDATANSLTLTNNTATNLGAINLANNLIVTSNLGAVNDTGILSVSGTTSVTATGQEVRLNSAGNDFGGAVSVSSGAVWLVDANNLELGEITTTTAATGFALIQATGAVTGSQNITTADYLRIIASGASGSINLTGEVVVNDTTTFDTLGNISVDNASNDFIGNVAVRGADVMLQDNNNIVFGPAVGLTSSIISGELNLTSGGSVTDTGQIIINGTGTSTIDAGSAVVLDNATNDFTGPIGVVATSATLVDRDDIILDDINVGAGALNVTANAGGGVTDGSSTVITQDTGTSITAGASSFTAGVGADIDISNSGNDFSGAVSVASANDASITDANDLTLGAITLSDAGSDTGDLTVMADNITGSGLIDIDGDLIVSAATGTVDLDDGATEHVIDGSVFATADVFDIRVGADGVNFGSSTITSDLTIETSGDVTQSGPIVGGPGDDEGTSVTVNVNAAGVDIVLLDANDFSSFAIGGGTRANSLELRDTVDDLSFGVVDVETDFTLEVVGDVDSAALFDIDGDTRITVTGSTSSVTLSNSGNTFGVGLSDSLTVDASGSVSVDGSSATGDVNIDSGESVTLTIDNIGGTTDVTATSSVEISGVTSSGAINVEGGDDVTIDVATISGVVDVDASGTVDIDGTSTTGNVLIDSGDSVSLTIDNIGGSVNATATGDIDIVGASVSGGIDANGDDISIDVATVNNNVNVDGASVTINTTTIFGSIDASATSDVDITATNGVGGDVDVDGADVSVNSDIIVGTLNVSATGDIDASGSIYAEDVNVDGVSVTINVANIWGEVNATASSNVDIDGTSTGGDIDVDGDDVSIDVDEVGGRVLVNASGDVDVTSVSVTNNINIDGASVTIDVGNTGGSMIVDAASNVDIDGNTVANNVTVEGASVSIDITKIGGAVDVDATSNVDIDSASVADAVSVVGDDVLIDVNQFGDLVNVTGSDTTIISAGAVTLGQIRVREDLTIDANNNGALGANSATAAIQQSADSKINVTGATTLDANGGDVDLLKANVTTQLEEFVNPTQPNRFGGAVTVNNANDISLGSSTQLTIGGAVTTGPGAEIVLLAPDFELAGALSAPTIKLFSSGGSTSLGSDTGGGVSATNAELANLTASSGLFIFEAGDMTISDLSLSGSKIGELTLFADGNVVISGDVTSAGLNANGSNALDLSIIGPDNIYITGKLGVEGEDTLKPLGDLTLLAKNDILIGSERFISITDTAQFEGANLEVDLVRIDETIIHTVGAGANLSTVTFGASGNIAMQTTSSDIGTGLEIGTLVLTAGFDGGAPDFINLFGNIVVDGNPVSDTAAALGVTLDGIPVNLEYELNGCVIRSFDCTAFGAILTTIPFDDSLFLDLSIEPEEDEDDDPFTNRGNEEEWR